MSIIKDFHVSKPESKPKSVVIDLSNDEEDEEEEVPPVKIKIEKSEPMSLNVFIEKFNV
jgi:hypothetical protein